MSAENRSRNNPRKSLKRNFKSIAFARSFASLLIAALLLPAFFIAPYQRAKAGVGAPAPTVISAPPEPFVFAEAGHVEGFANIAAAIGTITSEVFGNVTSLADSVFVMFISSKPKSNEASNTDTVPNTTDTEIEPPSPPPAGAIKYDFDGDGKADTGRWRSDTAEFKVKNSGNGSYTTTVIGSGASKPAPGDYDGDGKTDATVFNAGSWNIKRSSDGATQNISWGTSGDVPVSGNYDNDNITDFAVFRPSTGTWWIQKSTGGYIQYAYGLSTDIPMPGNYDGDSFTDYAVYRPSNGIWYIQASTAGAMYLNWGLSSDTPVHGDFDGDNKDDPAVYRPSDGTWYVLKSSTNYTSHTQQIWGNWGDQPAPADYDGDGKADMCIWRPSTGVWHTIKSSNGNYDYQTLGISGDFAIPSAYTKQSGWNVAESSLAAARLSPRNATGGTDLYSQNFGWGTSLVNLPGRAGLDAGFGISYNSLVWTKDTTTNTVIFDADDSNITPGFRFGFPVIEPSYYKSKTLGWAYMMVTPSGGRVEFRQTAVSGMYETADSSYAQLVTSVPPNPNDPDVNITIIVTTTDGTKMNYEWNGGAFRCSKVTDRNGNYITINHDDQGLLRTVTDTLGRVVTVNYDTQLYPTTITQTWKDNNGQGSNVTHTYATFTYATKTITTNFSGVNVFGPPNGTVIKVLDKVTYANGSSTAFDYNGYVQVQKVRNIAADNNVLNYVRTNLETPGTGLTDCPRFTETWSWVKDFNNNQIVVIPNLYQENQIYLLPDGSQSTGTLIQITAPNGVASKTYTASTGWREGLPVVTEDWFEGNKKRWTWTNWTQDDSNLTYLNNPRVIETKVGDEANVRKTTIDYHLQSGSQTASLYGLVSEVKVYDATQTTVLKRSTVTYNLDNAYLSRRIIGLPAENKLYDQSNALMSKITFQFDEGGFSDTTLQQNISPIQHDGTNYGANFITGRGNLTSTTRYDVLGETANVTSTMKYNTAGAPVSQTDPVGRTVKIGYQDSFSDGINNRNTHSYPTRLTDPAGFYSEVMYRFDLGANVWAKGPNLNATTTGKETSRRYDEYGRFEKETIVNSGAYTRYQYFNTGLKLKVFSTVTDINNDGADAGDEVVSETIFDGAGRKLRSRSTHPDSLGGYSGAKVEYDTMGRAWRSTVPTEIDENWIPAGDDQTHGWLWKSQEFDWKSRVTREINTDGTDVLIGYEGCGCAGGLVTTIQSELVPRDDVPNTMARRTQKLYSDILGRNYKAELLNWGGTVYSAQVSLFDGRDQVTRTRAYKGAATSPRYQTTRFAYDGHGRLKSKHVPQQEQGTNTTYSYYADDRLQTMTDARGATSTYTYNSRGLVDRVDYSLPVNSSQFSAPAVPCSANDPECDDPPEPTPTPTATPTPTPTPIPTPTPAPTPLQTAVTFVYDNAGNRTNMTDPMGNTAYQYNSLSQLTSETRNFVDSLPNMPAGGFTIGYTYGLGGQLKSITDPYNETINYGYDPAGRLKSVTGAAPYGGIQNYALNAGYRAWGGLKHLENGNGVEMDTTFNDRLLPQTYSLRDGENVTAMQKTYNYNADGSTRYIQDHLTPKFDRLNIYDHAGRIKQAKTGLEARGGSVTTYEEQKLNLPYRQSYGFNEYSNMTQRNNLHWGTENWYGQTNNLNYSYYNDRIVNYLWQHDADGRVINSSVPDDWTGTTYDARGLISVQQTNLSIVERLYNGDGREVKRKKQVFVEDPNSTTPPYGSWVAEDPIYYIRSSVLGGEVLSEVDGTGRKKKTFVRAAGAKIATQSEVTFNGNTTRNVWFDHADASGMSMRSSMTNGNVVYGDGFDGSPGELDPMGGNAGTENPYVEIIVNPPPPSPEFPYLEIGGDSPMYVNGQRVSCTLDGMSIGCGQAMSMMQNGSALPASLAPWQHVPGFSFDYHGIGIFSVTFPDIYQNVHTGSLNTIGEGEHVFGGTFIFSINWGVSIQQLGFQQRRITPDEADTLLQSVQNAANNTSQCRDYIKALIEKVAENAGLSKDNIVSTNIEELFNIVLNSRGPNPAEAGGIFIRQVQPKHNARNHWNWVNGPGHAELFLSYGNDDGENFSRLAVPNAGIITIHELLHVAIRGSAYIGGDIDYARAAADLAGVDRPDFLQDGDQLDNDKASRYWDEHLRQKCGFPSQITGSVREPLGHH